MRRLLLVVLALLLAPATAGATPVTIGPDGVTAPVFDYDAAVRERVFIPQPGIDQDGNGTVDRIAVDLIRPRGADGRVPAIIDPSPYFTTVCRGNETQCIGDTDGDGLNDKWPLFYGRYFVPRGYAYVLAQSNGTGNSTGCPLHGGAGDVAGQKSVVDWLNGRAPGYDARGNLVTAGWHNGSSAMIGKSYDGTLANGVAATGVAGLKTIVPISAISDWYAYSRMGGIRFNTDYPSSLSNTVTNADRRQACAAARQGLANADGDGSGDVNAFWDDRNYLRNVANVRAAVFAAHGLQDDNVKMDHLAAWWNGLAAQGTPRKLWLLREGHVDPFDSRRAAWVSTLHRWFDHWLQGVPNGIMDQPRVDIEDGRDTWNTYADWPLPTTAPTDVYLRGQSATAAGRLALSSGGSVNSVAFTSSASQSEATMIAAPTGSQTARRVFLSAPLNAPLRISGTPRVALQASLSKTQSNLGAVLVDYGASTQITRSGDGVRNTTTRTCWGQQPASSADYGACYLEVTKPTVDVSAWRVSRGILDSSNRASLRTPSAVTVNRATAFGWPLIANDYTFPAGHQIGVVLVGDYPDYPSAPGTSQTRITVDTRASKITLPVVGGPSAAAAAFGPGTTAAAPARQADNVSAGASGGAPPRTLDAP